MLDYIMEGGVGERGWYLLTKAKATNKSPVQIIDDLVREKVAAAI